MELEQLTEKLLIGSLVTGALIGSVVGCGIGINIGFQQHGLGGALLWGLIGFVLGSLPGLILGGLFGAIVIGFIVYFGIAVMQVTGLLLPLLIFVPIFALIGLLIWTLWGVGKP